MADRPFGFGLPDKPEDQGGQGSSGSGDSSGSGGPLDPGAQGPFGAMGNPQQFADALRQFADLLSWQGGPVNWDLAKNVARHAIVAAGDPSVLDAQRREITEAVRLADLWLDEATEFPSGIRKIEAWSRSEWLEATFPVWAKLCDPIAAKGVEAMSGMFNADPAQLGEDAPEELRQALGALGGDGLPRHVLGEIPVDRAALPGHQVGELAQGVGELPGVAHRPEWSLAAERAPERAAASGFRRSAGTTRTRRTLATLVIRLVGQAEAERAVSHRWL